MTFNLINSYFIKCKEKYDDNGLIINWDGIILVSNTGNIIGATTNNNDGRELIIGNYKQSQNNETQLELYRFFDRMGTVYLYKSPSDNRGASDTYGTFNVFTNRGISGLGDFSFDLEQYHGDYQEIITFYQETLSKICKTKDHLKISIMNLILKPKESEQEKNRNNDGTQKYYEYTLYNAKTTKK